MQPPQNQAPDAILLDDDILVHMTWKLAAKVRGKRLETFSSLNELLPRLDTLDSKTPIYIDSNLGGGLRGEALAREIHARGYSEIYLATGEEPGRFGEMPWIRAVVGKDAPREWR